ncbi:MAG: hypothetical protein QOI73_1657, partial [Solirubrobacteraceae bacterium]|nr:hypothetical protein [Solirubrobacteraceae bacterium]
MRPHDSHAGARAQTRLVCAPARPADLLVRG